MSGLVLKPGEVTLAQWAGVYRGASASLEEACFESIARGAEAVTRIAARGEPVYGINTGFGKLASVRIEAPDLTRLQRNIVLSHCAGVGDPLPPSVTRLMLALKITNISQGASGVRPETVRRLCVMLERGLLPVVPAQGSVGA